MTSSAYKLRGLLQIVKFEHSVFALPYAYVGALYGVASGLPRLVDIVWITVVMISARAFAFLINRIADKEIDARNPRTASRAIPAGVIKVKEALFFAVAILVLYLVGVWQLDPVARYLWPIPLVAFIVYPYTKRFTPFCHYWLGMCLGLAPVGGWVAVGGSILDPAPWILGVAVMLWTAGFDIIYATQDVECDVRDKIHSMPADYGVSAALLQTRIVHALTVALLIFAGYLLQAGIAWFVAVALAAVLLFYENSIVSPKDLSRVNAAFFLVNGCIAIIIGSGAFIDRVFG
ncbi:MAG: putative 4-hydroxybenzoate polyprenyltransferase [Actinobacteria bacterium]|nr:putative 4-hydroxybenzoate polyprenyltransferase [Actinomycetota bacterium]